VAGRAYPRDVPPEALDQVARHLHLTDSGLGLRIGDPESTFSKPKFAELEVAQFAHAHAAAPQRLNNRAATDVRATRYAEVRSSPSPSQGRARPRPRSADGRQASHAIARRASGTDRQRGR
jgi:hypothetical protein